MREIKFRGKRLYDENKDWKYGFYYLFKDNTGKEFHNILNDEEQVAVNQYGSTVPVFTNVDKNTLGQYTGLHDKNGKEIYEGDIVLYEDWERCWEGGGNDSFINKGIIEYIEDNCCFNVTEKETITNEDVFYEGNETLEVIGNIYDNPELLKED